MDPLSITASVITVVGTANLAVKSLEKLIRLKDVPDIVLALNNEVCELHLTLKELQAIFTNTKSTQPIKEFVDAGVQPSLATARAKLLALEELVQVQLKKPNGSLNRVAWLRLEDKIIKLQRELRDIRLSFGTLLGIFTSNSISTLETRFESLHFVSEKNHRSTQTLVHHTANLQHAFFQMLAMQKENESRLESIEKHVIPQTETKTGKKTSGDRKRPRDEKASLRGSLSAYSAGNSAPTLSALRMRFLQRRKCTPYCSCACHETTRFNTPHMLQFITGTLFVGYNNVPKLTKACTELDCSKSPEGFVAVNYYFPRWMVSRVLAAAIRFTDYKGPELSVRLLNVRDPSDLFFTAALHNDALMLKMLLGQRKASVLDVQHGTGHSALHLATMSSSIDAISVLLQHGAEPFLENGTQETPYDMAWNTVLCFEDTPNAEQWCVVDVKKLFPSTAALEERRIFSRIHQIVCKLSALDLETELKRSATEKIDEPDSDGRTALHWAAGRGDDKAVELLLRYGANPDTPDRIGQGPLRSSLKATDPTCLKLLIKYGASLMQIDHWEQTCLQASMYYNSPVAFGLPLIVAGIDVNARDFVGNTALLEAVRMGHSDAVEMLVDNGADVNLQDQNGTTPLMEAIAGNKNSMVFKLLQSPVIDTSARDNAKRSLLHHAAAKAQTPMLQLLSTFQIEGIDIHDKQDDGLAPIDVAEKRQKDAQVKGDPEDTVDQSWILAFSALLDHVVNAAQGPPLPYKPFKDEEDRYTDYSKTDSPCSSIYYDARLHQSLQIRTTRPSSLVGSTTDSALGSRPGSPSVLKKTLKSHEEPRGG